MKSTCRICVASLLLGLLLGITTATAEGNVAPPSWCPAEDYIYIPTSDVYHKSCWERILQIRDEVSNGKIVSTADIFESKDSYDAGLSFELGLIAFQSALNADSLGHDFMEEPLVEAENHFKTVAEAEPEGEVLAQLQSFAERGADIVKIVTRANTPEEYLETLRGTVLAHQNLKVPFIHISSGSFGRLHRMHGLALGVAVTFAVHEYYSDAQFFQPTIRDFRQVIESTRCDIRDCCV